MLRLGVDLSEICKDVLNQPMVRAHSVSAVIITIIIIIVVVVTIIIIIVVIVAVQNIYR